MDLWNSTPGEWMVVYEKLAGFLDTPMPAPVDWYEVMIHDRPLREGARVPTDQRVLSWQGWLRQGLDLLRDHRPWVDTVSVQFVYTNLDDRDIVQTSGPDDTELANRFRVRVHEVLSEFAPRVRFCGRGECRTAFIANKGQRFCSAACSQRARTERYRAKDPERVRRRRQAAYKRARARRLALRRKVARRGTS